MEQGVVDSPVVLVIRAPNQKYSDQTINCCQNWTVEKLKAHLADVYPSKPVSISHKTFIVPVTTVCGFSISLNRNYFCPCYVAFLIRNSTNDQFRYGCHRTGMIRYL